MQTRRAKAKYLKRSPMCKSGAPFLGMMNTKQHERLHEKMENGDNTSRDRKKEKLDAIRRVSGQKPVNNKEK